MNDLTDAVAGHDDETSAINKKHKKEKALRLQVAYEPVPAVYREPGSGILDGISAPPGATGFSFRLRSGTASKAKDASIYTKEVTALARKRKKYLRIRNRNGKQTRDTGVYAKSGGVSLVITASPWHVPTMARLGQNELEDLMLRLAEVAGREIQDVSGRPLYGGGAHYQTANDKTGTPGFLPHFHFHVMKSADGDPPGTPGFPYPQGKFLSAGPWITGSSRIETRFPGLLTEKKRELLRKHLARKDQAHLIDMKVSAAIDREMENFIREKGALWVQQAAADAKEYEKKKKRAQEKEPLQRIMQAALGHHARCGVWPLAYQAMTLSMWRMVPRELRTAVTLSIRAFQIVRNPSPRRLISMGKSLAGLAEPSPVTLPIR
jgi:hypothetical protein